MNTDLQQAIRSVRIALDSLRTAPSSPDVGIALASARHAIDALGTDLTSVVLGRLVTAIADCHHDGVTHSTRLAVCTRSTSVALRLDPRWTGGQPTPDKPRCRDDRPRDRQPTTTL